MAEATDNYINTDNWADNLLVKDDKGQFSYWKTKNKKSANSPKPDLSQHDLLAKASQNKPINDDFAPIQYWQGKAQDPAPFAFHPDDQKIIEELSKNTPIDDSKKYSVEKIVDRLLDKQSILLDSSNKKVFTDIVYNFFRGRRDAVFTRTALTTKVSSRSGALLPEVIDLILSVIKSIKAKIDTEAGLVVKLDELDKAPLKEDKEKLDAPKVASPPTIDLDIEAVSGKEPLEEISEALRDIKPSLANSAQSTELAPVKKLAVDRLDNDQQTVPVKISDKKMIPPPPSPAKIEMKAPLKPVLETKPATKAVSDFLPKVSRPSANDTAKKKVVDVVAKASVEVNTASVKSAHVLTGPLQELQSLDLINWRRLGRDAQERTRKVLEKINLLEHDSFTKKAQGISNWRQSPVYQMYLSLGSESMTSGKDVATLLKGYQDQGQDVLSAEEFSAISDLNKNLRF